MSLLRKIKRKLAPKKKAEADRISAQREKQVLRVMAKTGWDHDYTYEKMLQAHNTIGCEFSEYYRFGLYSYPDEELDFQYRVALDHKEAKKQRLENRVIVVMDNTGWTREKALEHIEMVKEEYGINSEDYVKYQLYNAPEDGFLQYYADKQAEEKAAYQAKKEDCVQKVMKKTGWNHQLAKSKMNTCIKRTHCTPKEYVTYRMYDLTEEEQDKVFLAYHSKQIMAKYDVSKNFITVLRNKELTNEMFSDLIKRAWCVNNKVSLEEFKSTFKDSTKIIYKPVGGHRGFGVETFELSPDTIDDVYNKLKDYPTGVVEEYVKQHPEINKICASSVNTIRIVTISSAHRPVTNDGKMFDIAYVAFRIGGGTSIVDNFHSGGMVAAVDKNTGIILTDAADGDGNVFKTHPVTGTKIKGFQIPYFKEAIDMVTKECQKHKIENYIGWDMAISETGPELIEVNDRPGVVLISTPFAAEKIGVKPEMEKYLPVDEEKLRADAKRTAQRDECVQSVMNKTGWSYEFAAKKMKEASEKLGCDLKDYYRFCLYEYSDSELEQKYKEALDYESAKKQMLDNRIISVMDNTGWDKDKALRHIRMVKEEYGFGLGDYIKYELYNAPDDAFMEYYEAKKQERRDYYRQLKEENIQKVMANTGWNHRKARISMNKCMRRTHCTSKEYVLYKMYNLTEEEQDEVFLSYHSKLMMKKFDVGRNLIHILKNKELTNMTFANLIKRQWCVNNKITLDDFKAKFANITRIIYKPVSGHRGFGVETFELSPDSIDDVYNKLKDYPTGVVEEYVKQHPDINKMCASSVNTIRIVTLSSQHQPISTDGEYFDVVYVAFRIGGGNSVVDNFHSGGMVAVVDKNTGVLVTNAVDGEGNVFETHPVTGTKIKGFQIPYFKEAIDMVTKECKKHEIENYLGWDMAISEDGPELIELNGMPGVVLISTPYSAEGIGVKPQMAKYLDCIGDTNDDDSSENDSLSLERYEIKKPDYDLIEREHSPLFDVEYPPHRYQKVDDEWHSTREKESSLFHKSARIMFTGDITCFEKQMETSLTDGAYNFDHEFRCIKDVLSQSDLAVGNLETMLYPQAPYRNEKYVSEQNFHCNAPLEFLQALRNAGFDVLTNANNHDMDTGAIGIGETIKYIEKFGFIHTGTFCDNRKRYQLIEVNGIKVAIVAFATEHNHKRCNLTDEGAKLLLNDYSKAKAKRIVAQAKKEGADVVFCCIHWGQENKTVHNSSQEKIANELADMGYDCIIGSHPHVLQDFDYIPTVEGKRVPVFYSMGNFVSHNSNCAKARTIVACIDIELEDGEPKLNCSYVPVFTSRSYKNDSFVVIPAGADSKDKDTRKKVRTISQVLGSKIDIATGIAYPDYIEDDCAKPEKTQRVIKPNLNSIKEFPYQYSDGKYKYSVMQDGAVLEGLTDEIMNFVAAQSSVSGANDTAPVTSTVDNAVGKKKKSFIQKLFSFGTGKQKDRSSSDRTLTAVTNSYTIPSTVLDVPITELADYAFADATIMKKVNFSRNILSISTGLFKGCTSLEGIQMAETTREICDHAFHGCTKLSAVVIKSNVAIVGSGAFADCTGLRTVKFKGMECSIADDAFDNCPMAVFYCAPGSQPERFALEHGFKVVNMIVE